MKRLILTFLVCAVAVFGLTAATKGDQQSKASSGAVQILTASATLVFTGLSGRNTFNVYNNGPNPIWCGWNSNITNVNGYPVAAGASLGVDIVYVGVQDKDFYCRADSADQVSPLDTRWIQVK